MNLASQQTQLAIPSDNVNFLSVIGTPNGRIFMAGKDGHLYELIYQAEDGWFTRKCRKVNHTYSPLTSLIPSFLYTGEGPCPHFLWSLTLLPSSLLIPKILPDMADPLFALTFDESRNLLYTLSEKNVIQVFYLGVDGTEFVTIPKLANIVESLKIQHINVDPKSFRIISIHPIRRPESSNLHLAAVTTFGERIFFTLTQDGANPPKGIQAVTSRKAPPPPTDANLGRFSRPHAINSVHTAFYSNGVLIVANAVNEDVDNILTVRPNSSEVLKKRILSEIATHLDIPGKVWSIAENPSNNAQLIYNLPTPFTGFVLQNELFTQYHLPPKEFYALTNAGIQVLIQQRPVDYLRKLISESGGQVTENLQKFFTRYSRDEACSMCLAVAAQTSIVAASFDRSQLNPLDQKVSQWATYIFFHTKDEPQARNRLTGFQDTQADLGFAVAAPELNYSNSHNGFLLYLARLIAPLWRQQVSILYGVTSLPRPLFFSHRWLLFLYM